MRVQIPPSAPPIKKGFSETRFAKPFFYGPLLVYIFISALNTGIHRNVEKQSIAIRGRLGNSLGNILQMRLELSDRIFFVAGVDCIVSIEHFPG